MTRLFIFTALLLLVMSCRSTGHDEVFIPGKEEISWTHNFYKDAGYFNYSVEFGLLNVGEVKIETAEKPVLIDKNPYYHVRLDAKIQGAAGWIASLNNHYESFVDTATLCPYKFTRNVQENKHRKTEYTIFDREKDIAIVTDTTRGVANSRINTFSVSRNIQDMITAFFVLRNASLERIDTGDTITIDAFLDNACFNIRVKYLGKEKVKSSTAKGRKINALVLAPLMPSEGLLAGETPVKIWVSEDNLRIPVKIQVRLSVGSVEMELKEYSQKNTIDLADLHRENN
jgi:hypothetical protein